MDPVDRYLKLVRRNFAQAANEKVWESLEKALRSGIHWQPAASPKNCEAWSGQAEDWLFILADFPIDSQPGRRPGDRGQNVVMISPAPWGITIASDAAAQHQLAHWLHLELCATYGHQN